MTEKFRLLSGYAGYVTAKLPPAKPSVIQEALWKIHNPSTFEVLTKLLRNVATAPSEEKYRSVKLSNPKISSHVREVDGALEALLAMGWQISPQNSDLLSLPKGIQLTMNEVRMVQDAEERSKRSSKTLKRSNSAAKLPASKDQARIREQMEADRLERASRAK